MYMYVCMRYLLYLRLSVYELGPYNLSRGCIADEIISIVYKSDIMGFYSTGFWVTGGHMINCDLTSSKETKIHDHWK